MSLDEGLCLDSTALLQAACTAVLLDSTAVLQAVCTAVLLECTIGQHITAVYLWSQDKYTEPGKEIECGGKILSAVCGGTDGN